jgi:Protein of unknown function (DUF1579)
MRRLVHSLSWSILVLGSLRANLLLAADSVTTRPDSQSSYEPRSNPGIGQVFLAKMAGDWTVVKTFYPAKGPPQSDSGTCTQTMINDGRYLQSDFVFGTGQDQTTGIGIIGFDPDSGRFTSVWADSRSTRMSIRQSADTFDGKQIILYNRPLGAATTRPSRTSRTITHLEDNDNRLVHRQYIRLPDGSERLVLELMMTRRLPATQPSP